MVETVHDVVTVHDTVRVNVYPDIPEPDLNCSLEPVLPDIKTEVQADLWVNKLIDAGEDCRNKLDTIRGLVRSWPKM